METKRSRFAFVDRANQRGEGNRCQLVRSLPSRTSGALFTVIKWGRTVLETISVESNGIFEFWHNDRDLCAAFGL